MLVTLLHRLERMSHMILSNSYLIRIDMMEIH
nr:MAG TPA: hypothetical protein [Caudoviricetes sp.]